MAIAIIDANDEVYCQRSEPVDVLGSVRSGRVPPIVRQAAQAWSGTRWEGGLIFDLRRTQEHVKEQSKTRYSFFEGAHSTERKPRVHNEIGLAAYC